MIITRRSPLTGKDNQLDIPVTKEQLELWSTGVHIQDAMPNLTPGQREFLMTGYTEEDWDKMFRETDEEDLDVMTDDELDEIPPSDVFDTMDFDDETVD